MLSERKTKPWNQICVQIHVWAGLVLIKLLNFFLNYVFIINDEIMASKPMQYALTKLTKRQKSRCQRMYFIQLILFFKLINFLSLDFLIYKMEMNYLPSRCIIHIKNNTTCIPVMINGRLMLIVNKIAFPWSH